MLPKSNEPANYQIYTRQGCGPGLKIGQTGQISGRTSLEPYLFPLSRFNLGYFWQNAFEPGMLNAAITSFNER
jgi:hypothetical protein